MPGAVRATNEVVTRPRRIVALAFVLLLAACGASGDVDDGQRPGNEPCAPVTGGPCSLAPQACTLRPRSPDFLYAAICSSVGPKREGESCAPHVDASDCEAGLACVPRGPNDPAVVCSRLCVDDAGCGPDQQCFVPGMAVAPNATGVGVCRATCTIGDATCGADRCTPRTILKSADGTTKEVGACNPPGSGTGQDGAACTTLDDCVDGSACFGAHELVCRPLCSADRACPGGSSCVGTSTSPDATGKWYGVCAPSCDDDAPCAAPATCQSLAVATDPKTGASVCLD